MKIQKAISAFLAVTLTACATFVVGSSVSPVETVFTDSLTDMSKVYAVDGTFQNDSNTNLNGDQCVAVDYNYYGTIAEDGVMTKFPSLTWQVNGGVKVETFVYLWDNTDYKFSWSADGTTFTDIAENLVKKDSDITTENAADKGLGDEYTGKDDVIRKLYTIDAVDASAKYVKVTWPQMNASYKAQLSMFRATGGLPETVTDITADTVLPIVAGGEEPNKANWHEYSKGKFEGGAIKNVKDGDIQMILLKYGEKVAPETYVTYKVKAGSSFLLKSARHVSMAADKTIKLFSSADNKTWTEIENVVHTEAAIVTADNGDTGYIGVTDIAESIPATHEFVKVVWPDVGDVNYGVALISAKFNKTDELASEDNLTEIPVHDSVEDNIVEWVKFSGKDEFQMDQHIWLNGEGQEPNIPFMIVAYNKGEGAPKYVTYEVKPGSPFVLNFAQHDSNTTKTMKLYSSSDGENFTELMYIAAQEAIKNADGSANNYGKHIFRVEAIPADHKFVKVEFPDFSDGTGTWVVGLISVKLMRPDKADNPDKPEQTEDPDKITGNTSITFTGDKAADTKKMDSYSKEGFDFSQMIQVGDVNISVLMLDEDFVAGKSELPELFAVYKVKANSPFKAKAINHQSAINLDLKFKFMVSKDGKEWKALENVLYKNEAIEGTSWLKETYGVASLGDVNYVKIVWPNLKDYTGTIDPVSENVLDSLSYAPALSGLSFNGIKTVDDTEKDDGKNPGTSAAAPTVAFLIVALSAAAGMIAKRKRNNL